MPTSDGRIGARDLCSGAAIERVIADGGVTSLKISATLQSDNYAAGSAGWQINRATGSCEFQDAVIRGTLNASDIVTGTLNASLVTVTNLNASNITTGTLSADRIATTALNASNITTGTLAVARIGSNSIDMSKIELTAALETGQVIRSSSYSAGSSGWQIEADGDAEFNNVTIRGTLAANTVSGWLTTTGSGGFRTGSSGTYLAMEAGAPDRIAFYLSGYSAGRIQVHSAGQMSIYTPGLGASIQLFGDANQIQLNASDSVAALTYYLYTLGTFETGNGSASAPSHSFIDDPDTGMYRYGTNAGALTAAGSACAYWANTRLYINDGTVSAPGLVFLNDSNTGLYRISGDYMAVAVGGSIAMQWGPTANKFIYGLQTGTTNAMHYNSTTGQITYVSSTRRIKQNIRPLTTVGLTELLRPSTFEMKASSDENPEGDRTRGTTRRVGLIAEDVAEAIPEAAIYMDDDPVAYNYEDRAILAALVLDLQDARVRIRELEDRLDKGADNAVDH